MEDDHTIKLSKNEIGIAEYACERCEESWLESHEDTEGGQEVPTPDRFPVLKSNILIIPNNADLIDDLKVRVQDQYTLADEHVTDLNTSILMVVPKSNSRADQKAAEQEAKDIEAKERAECKATKRAAKSLLKKIGGLT